MSQEHYQKDSFTKDGDHKKLVHCVYPSLSRCKLSILIFQELVKNLKVIFLTVREKFVLETMSKFVVQRGYYDVQPQTFGTMDETAVCFKAKPNSTGHHAGANTISVRCSGRHNRCCIGCVSLCSSKTKLPLLCIFNSKPNGDIEKNTGTILPSVIYICCQLEGLMN